jgi:hypothetical protein
MLNEITGDGHPLPVVCRLLAGRVGRGSPATITIVFAFWCVGPFASGNWSGLQRAADRDLMSCLGCFDHAHHLHIGVLEYTAA